ncbi:hypothetical protein HPB47_023093 [Ixodes persulcatus]|uniref:Uncharacterized protein n=1 Tax=Ixodes persulcatus TaxID=34615 RepID=A0AC60QB44_IXOPE|nr:hypothetical protein HPB47_023093 [Ixodes persulcatus]
MTTPLVAPPRLQLLQATQDHAAVTSCETSPPPSQEMDEDAEAFGPSNNAKRFRSSDDSLKDADTSLQASWASREPDATDLEELWEKATTRIQRRAQLKASGQPLPTTSRKERVTLGTHVIKIQPTERCDVLGLDPEELKTVFSSFAGDLKLLKHQILRQVPTDGISRGVIHGCKPKERTAKLLEALYADEVDVLTGRPMGSKVELPLATSERNGARQALPLNRKAGGVSAAGDTGNESGCARLKEAAELAHLTLANDLDYPTRHGLHEGQRDTTPNLTWADSRLHTTYADDITLWVDPRNTKLDTKETVVTMQTALDAIDQCLQTTGMQPSPEKTAFLIVGGLEHNRAQVHLTLSGQPIQRSPERWIRILRVPLHEQGGAQEWIKQLKPKWRQQLQLIKRMGNRLGGAGTRTIRLLTQAVLTSKACYGATCFILTKAQHKQLEILHRECLRAITGLPRQTKTEELYRYSNLPTLQAIIETRVAGHQRRRTST